jgi:hypothetical protein
MEDQAIPYSDDELKARNEVLKLKLHLEHGMRSYQCDGLSPQLENQWLNYIYRHEQLHHACGRVSVYDYVGRPPFNAIENLEREQVTAELERLLAVMRGHGVQLDCICEYDDAVIYRFLTTELFIEEMDNIRMPGLVNHFTYEDFHMNNQYEIERIGVDLIKSIYNHEWRAEYDSIWVGSAVKCNGVNHDFHGFSSMITAFQQRHSFLEIRELNINEVSVDEVNASGQMTATLLYVSQPHSQQQKIVKGECSIFYLKDPESGHWHVTDISMPGVY